MTSSTPSPTTTYRTASVDGLKVFYREAGNPKASAVLLLHGFPTSSHLYRELIPALADRYHVVAPDLPGFGFSEAPDRKNFKYTFDHLAKVIERFTEVINLTRYALYVFDYGAPVGFRLAVRHPERIAALISQNGNAYEEGLSDGWNPIQAYWKDPSPENRSALRAFLTPETTQWQYTHGPAMTRSNSIYSATIRAMSRSTPNSKSISAQSGLRYSRYGARTIPSFCLPVHRLSNATTRTLKSTFSMPVILLWRVAALRLQRSSATSSLATKRCPSNLKECF